MKDVTRPSGCTLLMAVAAIAATPLVGRPLALGGPPVPATDEEIHASSLQYVRKISGSTQPSKANAEAFDEAVAEVERATHKLLGRLVAAVPPKNREEEAEKARQRWRRRSERMSAG